jgi:hypothetical protein
VQRALAPADLASSVPSFCLILTHETCRTVCREALLQKSEHSQAVLELAKMISPVICMIANDDKLFRGLRHTRLELRPRSTWRNTHAVRKGETTRNPKRTLPSSSYKRRDVPLGGTGIRTRAGRPAAEFNVFPGLKFSRSAVRAQNGVPYPSRHPADSETEYEFEYESIKGRCPSNVLSDFRLSEHPVISIPIAETFPIKSDPIRGFPIFCPILCPSMRG